MSDRYSHSPSRSSSSRKRQELGKVANTAQDGPSGSDESHTPPNVAEVVTPHNVVRPPPKGFYSFYFFYCKNQFVMFLFCVCFANRVRHESVVQNTFYVESGICHPFIFLDYFSC